MPCKPIMLTMVMEKNIFFFPVLVCIYPLHFFLSKAKYVLQ